MLLPKPTPANVVIGALPERFRFLIVLFVAGSSVPTVWPQITALAVPVFVFAKLVSRVVPPTVLEPSIVTQSAPFRMMRPWLEVP